MDEPSIDDLLDILEEAQAAGEPLKVEDVCRDYPDLIAPLREKWRKLQKFNAKFDLREGKGGSRPSQDVNASELVGTRLVLQSELHLEAFHERGGLGEVFLGVDSHLTRTVAVKLLRSDRHQAENLEDFQREAQIIGRMNHPGIVSIHGAGETIDGRPFYAMPFLAGGNLRSHIKSYHDKFRSRLVDTNKDFRDLIYRLSSVCKTIAYAHSRGIIHRDLKAENILLGKYGETLVIDWGCATKVERDQRFKVYTERTLDLHGIEESTSSGGLTLRYASPEQLHGGKPVGPESDIYSLGSILYLILSGQSPLENELDERVRQRVLDGDISAPESLKSGVPRPLAAICKKAMSKEPADRYETALLLAEDLDRYLADEHVEASKDPWGLRLARIVRRNRTASVLLLSTLLVGSLLLGIAYARQSLLTQYADASAKQRLSMAAELASNVGGFEIDRRFTLLEQAAKDPRLIGLLADADPTDKDSWIPIQNVIYEFKDELNDAGVELESLFLTDAQGNQFARAPKSGSIGKNYAFRHYFHGREQDLDPKAQSYKDNPPSPAIGPVISNVYVSTNRNANGEYPVKTAFTVPVFQLKDGEEEAEIIGRLGMSVNINHLSILDRLADISISGALVETRDYDWGEHSARGLILDRIQTRAPTITVPVNSILQEDAKTENEIKASMPRLTKSSTDLLLDAYALGANASAITSFLDPAMSEEKHDAAFAQLTIPHRPNIKPGWTVIFFESPKSDATKLFRNQPEKTD